MIQSMHAQYALLSLRAAGAAKDLWMDGWIDGCKMGQVMPSCALLCLLAWFTCLVYLLNCFSCLLFYLLANSLFLPANSLAKFNRRFVSSGPKRLAEMTGEGKEREWKGIGTPLPGWLGSCERSIPTRLWLVGPCSEVEVLRYCRCLSMKHP